jgi:hypothetical protein
MQPCCWTSSVHAMLSSRTYCTEREPHQPFFMSSSTRQYCCFRARATI